MPAYDSFTSTLFIIAKLWSNQDVFSVVIDKSTSILSRQRNIIQDKKEMN